MGILFAYVTADYHTVSEYFLSLRVWQFFLYHIMLVVLGLYIGFSGIFRVFRAGFSGFVMCFILDGFSDFLSEFYFFSAGICE